MRSTAPAIARRTRSSLCTVGTMALVLGTTPLPAQNASFSLYTPFTVQAGSSLQHAWRISAVAGTFGQPPVQDARAGSFTFQPGFVGNVLNPAGAFAPHSFAFGMTAGSIADDIANGPPFSGAYASEGTLDADPGAPAGAALRTTSSMLVQGGPELAFNIIDWTPDIDVTTGGIASVAFSDQMFGSRVGSPEMLLTSISGHLFGTGTLAYNSTSLTVNALGTSSGSLTLFASDNTATGGFFGGTFNLSFANGSITSVGATATELFSHLIGDPEDPSNPLRVGAPADFTIATFGFPDGYFLGAPDDGDEFRLRFAQHVVAGVGLSVPEPSTILLLGGGLIGLAGLSWRRAAARATSR